MQDLVPPSITTVPPTGHDATTSNLRRVAVSAAVVLVALGWTAAGCGEDGTTAPTTSSSTSTTTRVETTMSAPVSTTTTTLAPVSTTTTTLAPRPPGPVSVTTEISAPVDGEILYEASVGSSVDQLGLEDCAQCDPNRPLAPMMTSDGRLLIVDPVNHRWVVVDDGTPTTVPLPADLNAAEGVMGPGDIVYLAMLPPPGTPASAELLAFDADDLAVVLVQHDTGRLHAIPDLRIDGTEVVVQFDSETRFPLVEAGQPPRPRVTLDVEGGPATVTVTFPDGGATVWVFDPAYTPMSAVSLADGSIAVVGTERDYQPPPHRIVWLLRPDGSSSARRIDGLDVAFNTDSWFIDSRGVIMLVSPEPNGFGAWQVVRLPLAG